MREKEAVIADPSIHLRSYSTGRSVHAAPLYLLAITWLTIPILIWLTAHGNFSFQQSGPKIASQISLVSTATETDTLIGRSLRFLTFPLLLLFIFPYLRRIESLCRMHLIFALLATEAVLSVIWSQFPVRTLPFSLNLVVCLLFAHAFLLRFSREDQLRLLYWTGWCVGLGSLAMVVLMPRYAVSGLGGNGEWNGLLVTKNVLARACVFLLTPAFFLKSTSIGEKFLKVFYFLLIGLLIFKSSSATGLVIAMAAVALSVGLRWFSRADKKEAWLSLLFVSGAVGSLVWVVWQFWSSLSEILGKSVTLTGRTDIWAAVFVALMKRPILGYGLGGFWWGTKGEVGNMDLALGWAVPYSHNGFLDVWVDLGLVGLVLIIASLIKAFLDAFYVIRKEHTPYAQWCLSIVILTILYNLDEGTLLAQTELSWVLYLLACTALAVDAKRLRAEASVLSPIQR